MNRSTARRGGCCLQRHRICVIQSGRILCVVSLELSGIQTDLSILVLAGKHEPETPRRALRVRRRAVIKTLHERNPLGDAPIAFVHPNDCRFEMMQGVPVRSSVLPVVLINANHENVLVLVKLGLELFGVLTAPRMKKPCIVITRTATGGQYQESRDDECAYHGERPS